MEAETASGAGDTIFVDEGDGTTTGQNAGIALKANQRLIGEGVALTVPDTVNGVVGPTLHAAGNKPKIGSSTGDGVEIINLAGDNTIRGLDIAGFNAGIDATYSAGVRTLTISDVTVAGGAMGGPPHGIFVGSTGTADVQVSIDNAELSVQNAAASGIVLQGASFTAASGTLTVTSLSGNSVPGGSTGRGIDIGTATFDATPGGGIQAVAAGNTSVGTNAGNRLTGPGIDLNTVKGSLTFTDLDIFNTGGTGLEVDNSGGGLVAADFTLTVNNGANSTVDTTNGTALDLDPFTAAATFATVSSATAAGTGVSIKDTAGTVTINGGTITGSAGTAFNVDGGNANVTYSGNITNTAGRLLEVVGTTGGTVSLDGTTLSDSGAGANTGTGIRLNDVAGSVTVTAAGTTIASPDDDGIEISGASTGTFTFDDVTVTTPAGDGVLIDGGAGDSITGTADFNNVDITNPTSEVIRAQGVDAGGSVDFDTASTITRNDGGVGIVVTSNSGGSSTFGGTTKAVSTGTTTAVDLTNNTGHTINFTGGGLDIDTISGVGFNATGGGTVNVSGANNTINTTNGTAVNITDTTIGGTGITLASVTTTSAALGTNLDDTGAGTVTVGGGSIGNASNKGIDIQNHDGNFSYAGTIGTTVGGRAVEVTNSGGGAITFSGAIDDNGQGIFLDNNDVGGNATITFSGGLDLDTTTNAAFTATNGGIVNVSAGATNTIDTSTGTGVNIADTTIGATGVTFDSISVNGAVNGIVLDTTGTSGTFTVSGDGTLARNGSGGTIQSTTGDGIVLDSADSVILQSMNLTNVGDSSDTGSGGQNLATNDHGIQSQSSSDVQLRGVDIDTPAASGWEARDLSGTSNRIDSNSRIQNVDVVNMQGLEVVNTGANPMSMTIDGSTFRDQASTNGSSFLNFQQEDSGSMNVTFTGNTVEDLFGVGLNFGAGVDPGDTGTITTTITGNTFRDAIADGLGVLVHAATEGGNLTCTIGGAGGLRNTFQDVGLTTAASGVIQVQLAGGSANGDVSCDILNNLIDEVAPVEGASDPNGMRHRGISVVSQGTAATSFNIDIQDNDIFDVDQTGITVSARNSTGLFEARISGNDVGTGPDGVVGGADEPVGGIIVLDGVTIETQGTALMNVEVTNNDIVDGGIISEGLQIDATENSTMNVTVTGNNVRTAGSDDIEIRTVTAAPTMCVDVRSNVALGTVTAEVLLREDNGTMLVEGAGFANVTAGDITGVLGNTGANSSIGSGTPAFNGNSNCTQPVITALPAFDQTRWFVDGGVDAAAAGDVALQSAPRSRAPLAVRGVEPLSARSVRELLAALSRASRPALETLVNTPARALPLIRGRLELVPGIRRTTASPPASSALRPAPPRAPRPLTLSTTIGTIPAGKSVTVKIHATVNSLPDGTAQLTAQGVVTGANFTSLSTDDPDVGGGSDPTVTPADDPTNFNPPVFTATGPFSIAENSSGGTAVGDIDANDGDGGANDVGVTFSITAGNGSGAFAIDASTGAITVASSAALDFESTPSFTLTVQADDGSQSTASVVVSLTPVNEPPVFTATGPFSVAANAGNGTSVGDVDANNGDGGVTYSITAGNGFGAFFIGNSNGAVTVANSAALDFDTTPTYTLTVRADDGTLQSAAPVVVNLTPSGNFILPMEVSFPVDGGDGVVSLSATGGWTATSNAPWIVIATGASSGTGNASIPYSVVVNATGSKRSGTVTMAGQTFTVKQAAEASSLQLFISELWRLTRHLWDAPVAAVTSAPDTGSRDYDSASSALTEELPR